MSTLDKSWITSDRTKAEYVAGLNKFLAFAFKNERQTVIYCPCKKCLNRYLMDRETVRGHCYVNGFEKSYTIWDKHGEPLRSSQRTQQDDDDDGEEDNDGDEMIDMVNAAVRCQNIIQDRNDHIEQEVPYEEVAIEEPNAEGTSFYNLLNDANEKLYPGCPLSKLSVIVKLLHMKTFYKMTNTAFDAIVSLIREIIPAASENIPDSHYTAKKYIAALGLEYQKIDACPNDCVLYRGQYSDLSVCPNCSTSRYKQPTCDGSGDVVTDKRKKKVPQKVLRYFSPIKRLQCLYSSEKTTKYMKWHDSHQYTEGIMKHPSDSQEWAEFDTRWPDFKAEIRNVRLGLATDGFQPFGNLSSLHSIWPVVLIPYNLPPWMCMKQPYFMLSLIIPGPRTPGMDIDVYLQPLIDDLNVLWQGVSTYDAHRKHNFIMRAALLWTISDFPALADLSGWSTKGKLACHVCYDQTSHTYLKHSKKTVYMGHRRFLKMTDSRRTRQKSKFDGTVERSGPPRELTGEDILEDLYKFTPTPHGKIASRKRKYDETNSLHNWRKRSIFFELPYWQTLTLRHCIDVMHTEKNVSENIFSTLLNIKGKTKDTPQSRMDLQEMRIRPELHLRMQGRNTNYMPPALFALEPSQRVAVFDMLKNLKTPDSYMSNISRCIDVTGKKLSGLKSHDYHILLQQLLPLMIKNFLPHSVAGPLIGLSSYYKSLCAKVLKVDDLKEMEKQIVEILCGLEQIFPPSFFTSMVHITLHLAREARIAGPVQYRWMYPIERYLRRLKDYVRNKAKPAGSIAEAYLADECMTFCSRYMADADTQFNRPSRNEENRGDANPNKLNVFNMALRTLGASKLCKLTKEELDETHFFILNNCTEVEPLLSVYNELKGRAPDAPIDCKVNFIDWIFNRVTRAPKGQYHKDLIHLAHKPIDLAHIYSGCIVNGFRFNTKERDRTLKTFNHGIVVEGVPDDPISNYYGTIENIVKITYGGGNHVILFKCNWFNVGVKTYFNIDRYGITSLRPDKFLRTDDLYVFADQAAQVIYIDDLKNRGWVNVIKTIPRDVFNIEEVDEEVDPLEDDYERDPDLYNFVQDDEIGTLVNQQAEGKIIHIEDEDQTSPNTEPVDVDSIDEEEDEEEEEEIQSNDSSSDED